MYIIRILLRILTIGFLLVEDFPRLDTTQGGWPFYWELGSLAFTCLFDSIFREVEDIIFPLL